MPLQKLQCHDTCVSDLSPLRQMPLQLLKIERSAVADLSPLAETPLQILICQQSRVHDLAPLHGMRLKILICSGNAITELSPLTGMALTMFNCDGNLIEDLAPLHGMPLHTLGCSSNAIHDLTPLRGMPLQHLFCANNIIGDLAPLTGLALRHLNCAENRIVDLSPLRDMPLAVLECQDNAITDLSPVSALPLRRLSCGNNPVHSLHPLRGMAIEDLAIAGIPLSRENVQVLHELPLLYLTCTMTDTAISLLLTHPTLQGMNGLTAAYYRATGEIVQQAMTAWQHPHAGEKHCPALHRYATTCGAARYLMLPFRLSRSEAIALSRCYGGTLACPSTPEQFHALHAYLASIIYYRNEAVSIAFHLGLEFDPVHRASRWLSGAPYQWHKWPASEDDFPHALAIPYCTMHLSRGNRSLAMGHQPTGRVLHRTRMANIDKSTPGAITY